MNKSINVLVTGGAGFIGSNLVDKLVDEGCNVLVIDDLSTGLIENQNADAEYIHDDLTKFIADPNSLDQILNERNISVVYHLAASADVFLSVNKPEKVYEINLIASIALLNACNRNKVKKFIFASTSAVFGNPEYLPVDEKHSINPISPYGLTKFNFEQYIKYFAANCEIDFTVLRLPNVYGYRQRPDLEGGVIAIFKGLIEQKKDIHIFGDGTQTRDWVNVADIVKAFIAAKTTSYHYETILLGSETQVSLNELVSHLRRFHNFDGKVIYSDARIGDIKHMVMSAKKAKLLLKWSSQTSLTEGLNELWTKT